jgi:5-methylcytosine-specific restriction endonuclease McrA
MQRVFVLDKGKKPLMPCHPARARQLLRGGHAVVERRYPFTIRLLDRDGGETQPVALKIDPGYSTTGLALVSESKRGHRLIWAAELAHRGGVVKKRLESRRAVRRGRRSRNLRYRSPRFLNRREKYNRVARWLPPSMHSRLDNVTTWVARLRRFIPVASLSLEWNKFDTQKMQTPEISGIEYQRGELYDCEAWLYLLEKWDRKCAYCGAQDVPLEREHIIPKSRGGTNRISNLALSCRSCNEHKGNKTAAEFGHPEVQIKAKESLKAAAALTATRWALLETLNDLGLPIELGTGGMTYYNRSHQGYDKQHWVDAACVGESGRCVFINNLHQPLLIRATGRGSRQMCITNKHGFPIKHRARHRENNGFRTGDIVLARPDRGRRAGKRYVSCAVSNASTPSLCLNVERNFFTHHRNCVLLQRTDGYEYRVAETGGGA